MFTGLVVGMGEVVSLSKKGGSARLALKAESVSSDAALGDSICVNGVCLTVVEINGDVLSFDVSDETLRATNLGAMKPGHRVNLEPSLRPNSKMGGHFVTGHVDAAGVIKSKATAGEVWRIVITTGRALASLLVEKGSVAVDGISLTVVDVYEDGFSLVIIPHTAKLTTIGFKGPGDTVNVEADILGKYVAKFLGKTGGSALMKTLREEGFA